MLLFDSLLSLTPSFFSSSPLLSLPFVLLLMVVVLDSLASSLPRMHSGTFPSTCRVLGLRTLSLLHDNSSYHFGV